MFGPLLTGFIYTRAFSFFLIMIGFAVLGCLTFLLLPPIPRAPALPSPSYSDHSIASSTPPPFPLPPKPGIWRLLCSRHMLMHTPSTMHMGFIITYIYIMFSDSAASVARDEGSSEALANRKSSFVIFTVGVMQALGGPLCGKIIDRWGMRVASALLFTFGIISYLLAIVSYQSAAYNLWWFAAAFFFGLASTFERTINFSIAGSQFPDRKRAFALFRVLSSLASAVGGFVCP